MAKIAAAPADRHSMLDDMSAAELTALIAVAEERRDAKMAEAKRHLIEEMKSRAGQLGLSIEDLFPRSQKASAAPPGKTRQAKVKYADHDGNTWSGQGRMAGWLKKRQEAGEDIEQFRVKEAA